MVDFETMKPCTKLLWTAEWLRDINPFKPDFTIAIFIRYKPRIAVAIPDL